MSSSQTKDNTPSPTEKVDDKGVVDADGLTVKDILKANIFGGNVRESKPNVARKTGHSVKPAPKASLGKPKPLKSKSTSIPPGKPAAEKSSPKVSEAAPRPSAPVETKQPLSRKSSKSQFKHKRSSAEKPSPSLDETPAEKVVEEPKKVLEEETVEEVKATPQDGVTDEPTEQVVVQEKTELETVGSDARSSQVVDGGDETTLKIVDSGRVKKDTFTVSPLPEEEKRQGSLLGGISTWFHKTFKVRKSSIASSDSSFSYPNVYRDERNRKAKSAPIDPVSIPRQSKIMQLGDLEDGRGTEEGKSVDDLLVAKTAAKKVAKDRKGLKPQKKHTVGVGTSYALVAVFCLELIFNKVSFNGRCISKVLYPSVNETPVKVPYMVELGYGACEYNLQTKAAERVFFGTNASDKGWPESLIDGSLNYPSDAGWDSPNPRIFHSLGALNTNYVRHYGENFRLFWSMFLHGGFVHLIFNVCSQVMILSIIEPDWGFWRTFILFFISGISGNLVAAVFSPSMVTIGSSGCLFGLIAALIPYCIENWVSLAHPFGILVISIIISVFGLVLINGETISFYAHMGGWIGGLLWSLATLKSDFILKESPAVDGLLLSPLLSWTMGAQQRSKVKSRLDRKMKTAALKKKRRMLGGPRTIKDTLNSIAFFKNKPLDIIIRILPLVGLVAMFVILRRSLYDESVYSTMFKPSPDSTGPQCCYLKAMINGKKAFWCFGTYESASHYCTLN